MVERLGDISVCIRNNDRKIIGFASLDSKTGEMLGLWVDPLYRRQGRAKEMIKELEKIAREETNLSEVWGTTSSYNKAANSIMTKLGYKPWNKWVKRFDN